ncbi:MAG: LolA-related protein [Pseudomonadales bacterium]
MHNITRTVTLLLLSILAAAAFAAEPAAAKMPNDTAVIAMEVLRQLQFPANTKREFTEQQFNPMLKAPLTSHGKVWIELDQTMVMELTQPRPEQRRLNGDQLALSRPRSNPDATPDFSRTHHRLQLNADKAAHLVLLAAGALLRGNTDWVNAHFSLSHAARQATPGEQPDPGATLTANWEVLLVPRKATLREQLPWIRLTGADSQLTGMRADRGSQGWQQLDFFALTSAPTGTRQ